MEIKDKRLVERMDLIDQNKYSKLLPNMISDSEGKYENIEIEHEPINLAKKIHGKINNEPEAPFELEKNDEI